MSSPELIRNVDRAFRNNCIRDLKMRELTEKLENKKATYEDAYRYAEAIGTARASAFGSEISSSVLPNGAMDYVTASRLMYSTLGADHEAIADFAMQVQKAINERAGIHVGAQKADLEEDRIDGFVKRLSKEENYDDVAWLLKEPVKTYARHVVDSSIKKNAEFQYKAGIKATVIRQSTSNCCSWCEDLAGDYTYPGVPREVFQRHDNCKCRVDYNGRKLTAYESKGGAHTFRDQGEQERKRYAQYTENKLDVNKELLRLARQGNTFYTKSDKLYEYAKNIKPIEGFTDIVGHGDQYSMVFKDINEKESNVSAKEFADIIEKGRFYQGGKIRLIACQTGAGDGIVPTYLAKRFNTEVLAPTEIVNIDFNGNMLLADDENNAKMGIETGEWALFGAKGRIK